MDELTKTHAIVPMGLLEKAVKLPHVRECRLCPSFVGNDSLNFLTEGYDVLGMGCEIEQRMCQALVIEVFSRSELRHGR